MALTINEKIYKVLTTKSTKESPYKSDLNALGLIVYNDMMSSYNYFSIKNPITNKCLVISKGKDNVKRLYNPYSPINNAEKENIKKVDFIGYLNNNREPFIETWKQTNVDKFKSLQDYIKWNLEDIADLEKLIEDKKKELESCKQALAKYQKEKEELFK